MREEEIAERVLEVVSDGQRKVAFVIGKVSEVVVNDGEQFPLQVESVIKRLVKTNVLEGFGDLSDWRHSEIRRAP